MMINLKVGKYDVGALNITINKTSKDLEHITHLFIIFRGHFNI